MKSDIPDIFVQNLLRGVLKKIKLPPVGIELITDHQKSDAYPTVVRHLDANFVQECQQGSR